MKEDGGGESDQNSEFIIHVMPEIVEFFCLFFRNIERLKKKTQ